MRKKILVLHSSSDMYGSGRVISDSIRVLKENNFEVFVLLPYQGPLGEVLEKLGATVVVKNVGALRRKYLNAPGLFNRFWKIVSVVGTIRNIIRRNQIDIVYSNTTTVLAGAIAAKMQAVPHLYHIHEIPDGPAWYSKVIGKFINFTSVRVVVVSDAVKNYWKGWVDEKKIIRIYNGMPKEWDLEGEAKGKSVREEFSIHRSQVLICAIGRILPLKGHSYLLDIAEIIAREASNVGFLIVGDPFLGYEELYRSLQKRVEGSTLNGIVHMAGFRSDIPAILNEADLLVHPSIGPDSLPTVILEAMHMSKPIAATDRGGASELIVEGETGIILPYNNPRKAAEMLLRLIRDKKYMLKLGSAGRKRVDQHFTMTEYNKQLLKTVNAMLQR